MGGFAEKRTGDREKHLAQTLTGRCDDIVLNGFARLQIIEQRVQHRRRRRAEHSDDQFLGGVIALQLAEDLGMGDHTPTRHGQLALGAAREQIVGPLEIPCRGQGQSLVIERERFQPLLLGDGIEL